MGNLIIFCAILGAMNLGSFKLENIITQKSVAELHDGKVKISDFVILLEIKDKGIYIPPAFRSEFSGKTYVFETDPEFTKAFIEIYCKQTLDQSFFQWSKL